jgi:hypothetical protein
MEDAENQAMYGITGKTPTNTETPVMGNGEWMKTNVSSLNNGKYDIRYE